MECVPDKTTVKPLFVKLNVEGVAINFEVDTGAVHSVNSEELFRRHFQNKTLYENDLILKDYVGHSFHPLGKLNLNVLHRIKTCYSRCLCYQKWRSTLTW